MELNLGSEEKLTLLEVARYSITTYMKTRKVPYLYFNNELLQQRRAVFVTLYELNQLRGSYGKFTSDQTLYEAVSENSIKASFHDLRFKPLKEGELDTINIEISVLSPLRMIKNIDEIIIGKHGLYITKKFNQGVMLPQVAIENKWDNETFLDYTCLKAGLTRRAWKKKDVYIYIYTAEVFSEKDMKSLTIEREK